ncbi:MAG: GAF domain-containing protein [Bryobacteraceae bacterium]|nr:GAF domain-containing protein [Bryobacteraceae bacterium]
MSLADDLASFEADSKEQLSAAWQLHVARVEEQLRAGWREQIETVLSERLAELAPAVHRETARAERALTERLNQTARRLRSAENAAEWIAILEETAAAFCEKAAVFDVTRDAIAKAPAIATAIESKDTVVALRLTSELSPAITGRFGEQGDSRCYLIPVLSGDRVVAVIYAQPGAGGLDRNALELLAVLAGAAAPKSATALIQVSAPQPAAAPPASIRIDWTALSAEEQELHLRAQRFARVRVAEIRLYQADAVRRGRQEKNLYAALKDKIDSGRADFRREFVDKCPSMADYLHREMMRTLANDDEFAMGPDYPGAMV